MIKIVIHFDTENPQKTLCGKKANAKNIALESWGSGPYPNEDPNKTYVFCKKCDKLADAELDALEETIDN